MPPADPFPDAADARLQLATAGGRLGADAARIARIAGALLLFVGALQIMKQGAGELSILADGGALVRNAGSTFGLGWIGAMIVLSGSPIAASALSLVAAGSISEMQGFAMLTGSRLGAAFVVLFIGVVYALRGERAKRGKPLGVGITALVATACVYIPAALIGIALLRWHPFASLNPSLGATWGDWIDTLYGPVVDLAGQAPGPVAFVAGLLALLVSFRLLDAAVPEFEPGALGEARSRFRSRWTMFALGGLVALVTMSVSVALGVLVPLVARNVVRKQDVLPYVMGANIATLGDTLLAGFLLGSDPAVRIVLAGLIATTIVSIVLLSLFYGPFSRGVEACCRALLARRSRLAGFTATLFVVPVAIVALARVIP